MTRVVPARPAFVLACFLSFMLAALCGCGPSLKVVRGTLVKVERAEAYEPVCNAVSQLVGKDCAAVPRAYEATVLDSTGRKHYFMFFAPAGNAIPQEGWRARWTLHRRELVRLPCTIFGCQFDVGWALDGDEDVAPIEQHE